MEPPPIRKSPEKPPLITPSASPPPVRSFFPQPYRLTDSAPPLKRQRFLSISRQSSVQSSSPAKSTPEPPLDLQKEREASTLRLLDVWSQLAERYTRRLDEDDIVDIRTGEIVKDNGVIRKSRKLEFGAELEPKNNKEKDGADAEEDEDDIDELDLFAQENGESDEVHSDMDGRRVPPVAPLDPRDAEDLRQFLEAERIRKEACGSEPEDDIESTPSFEEEDEQGDTSDSERPTSDDAEEVDEDESRQKGGNEQDDRPNDPPWDHSLAVVDDLSSDDELNNWEVTKASIVYPNPTTKKENADRIVPPSDSDSDVEIIEPPIPTKASRTPKFIKEPSRTQLQTPPYSKSSEDTDIGCSSYLVQPSASPPPTLSSPASHSKAFPPKRGRGRPRLKSSAPLDSAEDKIPIPRIDLAKLSKDNAQKRLSKKTTAEVLNSKNVPRPELEISPQKVPRLIPEVVIVKRRSFGQEIRPTHAASNVDGKNEVPPSKNGKGKEKEIAPDVRKRRHKTPIQPDIPGEYQEEDDDPIIKLSSSSAGPSKMKIQSSNGIRAVNKCHSPVPGSAESHKEEVEMPVPADTRSGPSRPSGSETSPRKRKRVVSSSEGDALQDETTPSTVEPKAAKSKSSKQHRELPPPHHKLASKSDSESPSDSEVKRRDTQKSGQKRRSKSTSRRSPSASGSTPPEVPSGSEVKRRDAQNSGQKRRSKSKPRRSPSASGSNSESEHSDTSMHSRAGRCSKSHLSSFPPPFYPYPLPMYPPPHPHTQPSNVFSPIPDPRAQFIISQAMHQLSALVGGPWPAPGVPYTPSRRRDQGHQPMYITPTHHPHPYTYAYNPEFSNATAPPDTPEAMSSPGEPKENGRRKSLVERSKSRGRRVSFKIEREDVDEDAMDIYSSPTGNNANRGMSERGHSSESDEPSPSQVKTEGKGKERKQRSGIVESKPKHGLEGGKDGSVQRVLFNRGQTPGPSTRDKSDDSAHEPSISKKAAATDRGRRRSRCL